MHCKFYQVILMDLKNKYGFNSKATSCTRIYELLGQERTGQKSFFTVTVDIYHVFYLLEAIPATMDFRQWIGQLLAWLTTDIDRPLLILKLLSQPSK